MYETKQCKNLTYHGAYICNDVSSLTFDFDNDIRIVTRSPSLRSHLSEVVDSTEQSAAIIVEEHFLQLFSLAKKLQLYSGQINASNK